MDLELLADERRFATAARVSEVNLALYRKFAQPIVRALASPALAEQLRKWQPLRVQYEFSSNSNPLVAPLAAIANSVRKNRSRQIVAALERYFLSS